MASVLYWLTHDLRFDDNPALLAATEADSVKFAFALDPAQLRTQKFQCARIGQHRLRFILESLEAFKQKLQSFGHALWLSFESPESAIHRLLGTGAFDRVIVSQPLALEETRCLDRVRARYPFVHFQEFDTYTLFSEKQLPFDLDSFPGQFTPFRKKAEECAWHSPLPSPKELPSRIDLNLIPVAPPSIPRSVAAGSNMHGGEHQAKKRLDYYFGSDLPKYYKEVRNELDGVDHSSKFSPYLSTGCLSVRRLIQRIEHYEHSHGANDSTYWLKFECLWREFFQWSGRQRGATLYQFKGTAKTAPLCSFYPQRFKSWCHGSTAFPLVNACMNQLRTTGYLSNRGRQIAASALIHELKVDWRAGAAWFEQQLIDYDPHSNWGNWQYIAGVGADPRGGRHFNIAKQAELYDPEGVYQRRWNGYAQAISMDQVDAADWPIGIDE